MTKVYVLSVATWNDIDSGVVSIHSTRASAEAAAAVLQTRKTTMSTTIEEYDVTP